MCTNESLLDAVRAKLRAGGVKLWLEPFWKDGVCVETELASLVNSSFKDPDFVAANNAVDNQTLIECLKHLQNHALEKLRAKRSRSDGIASKDASPNAPFCAQVKVVDGTQHRLAGGKKTLAFPALSFNTKVSDLASMILSTVAGGEDARIPKMSVRLISKGRTLEHDAVAGPLSKAGALAVIAIVSDAVDACTAGSAAAGCNGMTAGSENSVLARTQAIKEAAKRVAEDGALGDLELTDQHGNFVPLSSAERVPLVTAISLHALGKKILRGVVGAGWASEEEVGANAMEVEQSGGAEAEVAMGDGAAPPAPREEGAAAGEEVGRRAEQREAELQRKYGEALTVFLQADEAWAEVGEAWQSQVDNYGLLQLDICWVHLALEQLSALPDAEERAARAERVLMRQVHANFLTLAVLHAEEGKAVPALAAPFVRLLVVKGVVGTLQGRREAGQRLLRDGLTLCKALAVEEEAVQALLGLGASRAGAIVALRQNRGDVEQAGLKLLEGADKKEGARKERERQRRYGSTLDGRGPVDMGQAAVVQELLLVGEREAVSLLRLANNDVEGAVQLWEEVGRSGAALKVEVESKFGGRRKRGRGEEGGRREADGAGGARGAGGAGGAGGGAVDEVQLASVMSLGVDRERAEAALRNAEGEGEAKIESAMQWLLGADGEQGGGSTGAGGGGGSGGGGGEGEALAMEEDAGGGGGRSDGAESESESEEEEEPERGAAGAEARAAREQAYSLIEEELGDALRGRDLDEEHIGLPLDEERAVLHKYLASELALAQARGQ